MYESSTNASLASVSSTPPISTPPSTTFSRTLLLKLGSLQYPFQIPDSVHSLALQLSEDLPGDNSPSPLETDGNESLSSALEVLATYLEYVSQKHNEESFENRGPYLDILNTVLHELEANFLHGNEIHSAVATLLPGSESKSTVIRSYYEALRITGRTVNYHGSALLKHVSEGRAKIYAMFGGQGNAENYFDELTELYKTYRTLIEEIVTALASPLQKLCKETEVKRLYSKGLDIMNWLQKPDTRPDADYLISSPVSFPIIGLIQLIHYAVACTVLQKTPGEFRRSLYGITGHSQGIVIAAAIAYADTWKSFETAGKHALTILFWTGARSQQVFPSISLPHRVLVDSAEHGEAVPTPMLSVVGLKQVTVQRQVDDINAHLPSEGHICISLINGPHNFVVTGPRMSLYGLNQKLRKIKGMKTGTSNRTPYSKRGERCSSNFLPVTVPFHNPVLAAATEMIVRDLHDSRFSNTDLGIPLYHTRTGEDLQQKVNENLIPILVRMITEEQVYWNKATIFEGATHILDFGPGGTSGVGILTQRSKDGTGARVILAGTTVGTNLKVGYKPELFGRDHRHVTYSLNWQETFSPRLIKSSNGTVSVDTKMSRLLGVPPLMVGGMTPTTAHWDFVAATLKAGYHIEIATGGYYKAASLTKALQNIKEAIPPGRGITCNLIYINPHAIAWQIPLIRRLCAEGFPIEGVTVGAGVPSIDIATTWITTLGLRHIAFKPGSVDSINAVIAIARANQDFPVILQWTGGRGGGHHSYEDFHQPIIDTYSEIRQCSNIVLVAGSGFGGSEDTYPYLSGSWAENFQRPRMPFDGVMFGSRVMTAKETHTSKAAKEAIVRTEGVSVDEWEKTYDGAAGGIITVRSEMGEPIHKLATRGVLLWRELDDKLFRLDKSKRLAWLSENREYVIRRVNADFQKVWFGKNSTNDVVDLEDMTYAEVLRRLIDLMYIKREKRWVDKSWMKLTGDFVKRLEERFVTGVGGQVLQNYSDLADPFRTVERILVGYPQSARLLLDAQDIQFFIELCRRSGQKPVPFIPVLDENFETWFKKDSLWQCEDISAVVDEDVDRTCILHGPVAARYSKIADEPIQSIMNCIHEGHVNELMKEVYGGNKDNIPWVTSTHQNIEVDEVADQYLKVVEQESGLICHKSTPAKTEVLDLDRWFTTLAGDTPSWRQAIFTSDILIQEKSFKSNPFKQMFAPVPDLEVKVSHPSDPSKTVITASEKQTSTDESAKVIEISAVKANEILVLLHKVNPVNNTSVVLPLKFHYDHESTHTPIHEITYGRTNRVKEFYGDLWFEEGAPDAQELSANHSMVVERQVILDYVYAVGNTNLALMPEQKVIQVPLDFAMILGWTAMMRPLFSETIDCDLLSLVHLSNSFRMLPHVDNLVEGDLVQTTSHVTAIINQESGKMVEIVGTITKAGKPIIELVSQFLYRGNFDDYENTFESKTEEPTELYLDSEEDVAVLLSREWFQLDLPDIDLKGKTLTFYPQSTYHFREKNVYSSVETSGKVILEIPGKGTTQVATLAFQHDNAKGSPVMDYLERKGKPMGEAVIFDNSVPLHERGLLTVRTPECNEDYAIASGDYNPIHVSRIFAQYAGLDAPITHGMFNSAAVRAIVERVVADNVLGRMRSWKCSFVGKSFPNDLLDVDIQHVGMILGRKIVKVEVVKKETGEPVLIGEAEVEQPATAYLFTGQGSQFQGMGMDLYASSEAARAVWDKADDYFINNYGKGNPTWTQMLILMDSSLRFRFD